MDQKKPSFLDEDLVAALRDDTVREITRESSRLPERERRLLLGIVRQFGDAGKAPGGKWLQIPKFRRTLGLRFRVLLTEDGPRRLELVKT